MLVFVSRSLPYRVSTECFKMVGGRAAVLPRCPLSPCLAWLGGTVCRLSCLPFCRCGSWSPGLAILVPYSTPAALRPTKGTTAGSASHNSFWN